MMVDQGALPTSCGESSTPAIGSVRRTTTCTFHPRIASVLGTCERWLRWYRSAVVLSRWEHQQHDLGVVIGQIWLRDMKRDKWWFIRIGSVWGLVRVRTWEIAVSGIVSLITANDTQSGDEDTMGEASHIEHISVGSTAQMTCWWCKYLIGTWVGQYVGR